MDLLPLYGEITPDTVDLMIFLPITSETLCTLINARLGNPAARAIDSISYGGWVARKFIGTYYFENQMPDDGGNGEAYVARLSGCLESRVGYEPSDSGFPYFFYHVLLAR